MKILLSYCIVTDEDAHYCLHDYLVCISLIPSQISSVLQHNTSIFPGREPGWQVGINVQLKHKGFERLLILFWTINNIDTMAATEYV